MLLARARSLQARLLPHGLLDVVRQVLLFAAAYYAYRLVRGWIDDPQGATVAFAHARHLIHFEQTMGFFVEPSVQAWASTKPELSGTGAAGAAFDSAGHRCEACSRRANSMGDRSDVASSSTTASRVTSPSAAYRRPR